MENECYYVCSRGILKSCDFHSNYPSSSCSWDAQYLHNMIDGNNMFEKMSIYVCTDLLPYFIENIMNKIPYNFNLISGDSDATVPGGIIDIWRNPRPLEQNKCEELLNCPMLIKWFAQNCCLFHKKIFQLPIGLDYHTISNDPDKFWRGKNEGTTPKDQEDLLNDIRNNEKPFYERINKIFVNFTVNLNDENDERTKAIRNIPNELLHLSLDMEIRSNVWKKEKEYTFTLSPPGGGLDCHRTWESLCLGCIPIVKSLGSNKMYEDLPVLIVNEWSEINEKLLNDVIEKFKTTQFNYNKLSLKYWVSQFKFQKNITNPFEIEIQNKSDYNNEELEEIQTLIEKKQEDVVNLINKLYPVDDENYKISLELLTNRCTKGVCQKLIDCKNNLYPSKALYKIGNGGNKKHCFVCCTPIFNNRREKSIDIHQSLEKVGFNGYFYLFNGGFPNPSGTEMKYAAVPYCFKIFMMLEAVKLGFDKVIWLDAACYATNNPDRLFEILDEDDAIFRQFWPYTPGFPTYENTVLKETIQTLNDITKGNLVNSINVCSIVFGLNFNSETVKQFVQDYYNMVKIGTPFLSYFPEEVVISALFNKPEYKYLFYDRPESHLLFIHENYIGNSSERAKIHGYYFMQRTY